MKLQSELLVELEVPGETDGDSAEGPTPAKRAAPQEPSGCVIGAEQRGEGLEVTGVSAGPQTMKCIDENLHWRRNF